MHFIRPTRQRKMMMPIKPGIVTLGLLFVLPLGAQTGVEEEAESDRIQVTGSRIARTDMEQANPVLVISRDEIDARGVASISDLLQQLPIAGASLNQLGSAGTSFGAANINLRNLGANRTLVLVNGRRWINTGGGRGFRDFVDLNSIPLAAVESVEILKDGASAIYGSDAIAGVVNIRTRQDFSGGNLRVQYGETTEGDGEQISADLSLGAIGERGGLMLTASHVDTDPIFVDDRSFSRMPLGTLSLNSPFGRFLIPGLGTLTLIEGRDGTSPEDFRPFSNANDRVNLFENTFLTQPNKRDSIYGQARYHLTPSIDLVSEVFFTRRKSEQNFSPAVLTLRGTDGFAIPADHPFNPFGIDLGGSGFQINTQIADNIQRVNRQQVDTLRLVGGFEGVLPNGWTWDANAMYATSDAEFISRGQVSLDRIALGIGDVDRCAAIPGCIPINLFGGPGSFTDQQLAWIDVVGKDRQEVRLTSYQANLTGEMIDLPDGPLAFAAGIEYREERAVDIPDALINSPPLFQTSDRSTTGPPREPTNGKFDLTEYYLEINAPLLMNRPGAERLELSAAGRLSDFSTFGTEFTSKFGLSWKPIHSLLLRGTFSEGFRAPSILELFAGRRQTNLPANDPCSGGGQGLPGCAGVPADFIQSGSQILATVGSNPNLDPETSETFTFGFVYEPSFLPGFDLTADWYDIEVEDAIINIGSQRILDDCAFAGIRCNLITRAPNGDVINLIDAGVNIAKQEVRGVDLTARYRLQTNRFGIFSWVLDGAYLSKFVETIPNPAQGTETVDRRAGGLFFRESFPRWKGQLSTNWSREAWAANWRARYIHSMTENSAQPNIGSVTYHDVQLSYQVHDWRTSFAIGVNNLFDKKPPASLVNTNINFDISTYDARGQFVYGRIIVDF